MPKPDPHDPQDTFVIPPTTTTEVGKTLPGVKEAIIAAQILHLIKEVPAKTPGVAEVKAGAIKLAHAAGEKLSKAK